MTAKQFIKSNIFPIIIILVVIGIGVYLKYPKAQTASEKKTHSNPQSIDYDYTDAAKTTDTLEQFGLMANENFVVRDSAEVRRTPNIARYNTIYKLKFGTKLYTKNINPQDTNHQGNDSLIEKETRNGFVAVYSVKPLTLSDVPVGYMMREDIIEKSEFRNYKPRTDVAVTLVIPDKVKSAVDRNLTLDGIAYKWITDAQRFNQSLTYGDYNNDGADDFAVVLDRVDDTGSVILVYGYQPNKNNYNIIYKKTHLQLLKIKTITKNTKVNVNYEVTSFPVDGVHITTTALATFFQVFDLHDQSFMVFKN